MGFFFKIYIYIELHDLFAYFGDKFLVSKLSSKHFFPHSEDFFFLVWFTVSLAVQTFLRLEKLKSFVEFCLIFHYSKTGSKRVCYDFCQSLFFL